MPKISKKAGLFSESVIREMTRLCNVYNGINLSQGFPDFSAPAEMKEAATQGFRFLEERMWDGEQGGFYWEVDPAGTRVTDDGKYTVVQYNNGRMDILRYGQPWRENVFDNVILALAYNLEGARNVGRPS